MEEGYTLNCCGHNYVTLNWNGKFVNCFDNSLMRMEEIIEAVEKRTQMKFQHIPRENINDEDWDGLRFNSGFKKASEWL